MRQLPDCPTLPSPSSRRRPGSSPNQKADQKDGTDWIPAYAGMTVVMEAFTLGQAR